MRKILKKYRYYLLTTFPLLVFYYFSLPGLRFHDSYSTVLEDRTGKLLGATIADDGQWRFPEGNLVPEKFKDALIHFEDKRFYNHPGVDVLSMSRAIRPESRKNSKRG